MGTEQPRHKRGARGGELHWNYTHGRRSKVIRERRRAELAERLKAENIEGNRRTLDHGPILAAIARNGGFGAGTETGAGAPGSFGFFTALPTGRRWCRCPRVRPWTVACQVRQRSTRSRA